LTWVHTNNRDRYLMALSTQFSERVSSQALVYQFVQCTNGASVQFPASFLTQFVTTSGVHGHFVLTCDENFKGSKMQRLTVG
jgi:hypothetical protein